MANLTRYKSVHQPKAQGAVNYSRWFMSDERYHVDFAAQFEPYLVLAHDTYIRYDERFVDYGWNKVAFSTELHYAGYSFVVLPDVWAEHQAHPKTNISLAFSRNLTARSLNRLARYNWLVDMYCKYRQRNETCKSLS